MSITCHSGGCPGADLTWEVVCKEYGIKTISYSFENHIQYGENPYIMDYDELNEGWDKIVAASKNLNKPLNKYVPNYTKFLLCRNWFQIKNSQETYAIGLFEDRYTKTQVKGGTGWAVQMSINEGHPTFLFDLDLEGWYKWDFEKDLFIEHKFGEKPITTNNFAGIGTRNITDTGIEAINNIVEISFS